MAEFLASARWTRSRSKASDLQFFYDNRILDNRTVRESMLQTAGK